MSLTLGFEQPFESERKWIDAFYLYFKSVFDEYGIIAFNSNRDDVKLQTKPFFEKLIKDYEQFRSNVFDGTRELEKKNYKIQVPVKDDESFLFTHQEHERKKLKLVEIDSASLENLSPNVLLRPLYQDWIFPSVIYVAGNAEISYQLQLTKAYVLFERKQPMLFPRTHHVVLNPKMKRLLEKYKFNSKYNLESFDKWKETVLKSEKHTVLEALVDAFKKNQNTLYGKLDLLSFADEKSQKRILESSQVKQEKLLEQLEKKISNVLKRKDSDKVQHMHYLRSMIFPKGKLQERIFSISQFDEKSLIFAQQIFDGMDVFNFGIQVNEVK